MKDKRKKKLALNIKAERTRKGYTQFELAEKINMSESSISLIERGIQTPSVLVVYDIAKVLNIDINELFKNIE
ncbi:helix-turn-helix transcriptional regulator [bacterium]|nr:helix-turn-helix transcriptional regulator [bacterium]